MMDYRQIVCDGCGGDGGFAEVWGNARTHAIIDEWHQCTTCGGTGLITVNFMPIEMHDLEWMCGEEE